MGMEWRYLRGLRIWRINTKYNVLYVHGQNVPGPNHCYVRVFDTTVRDRRDEMAARQSPPPMPTFYRDDLTAPLPEELFHDELFQFTQDSILFAEPEKVTKKK